MTRRTAALCAVSVSLAAVLGACSGGAAPSTISSSTPAAASPTSAAPSSASSAEPTPSDAAAPTDAAATDGTGDVTEVEWVAKEFAFDGVTSIPAGPVSIKLKNEGQEDHQAQMALIAEGKSFEEVVAALANPDPSAAFAILTFVGGPTNVAPGEEQSVAAVLDPGNYVLLCFYAGDDGVPHLAKGMVAPLEVTGTAAGGELPQGTAELTLQDFAFVGLDSLPTGEQVVHVTNSGPQAHEASVIRLSEGVTVEDIIGMATASPAPSGPPPWENAGGIAALAPGVDGTVTLDLEAGNYAFVCFVPDPATGKSHFELGMIGALTVE